MKKTELKAINQKNLFSTDTSSIAKWLLGKYIVSSISNKFTVAEIVETEAYRAPEDKASHAYNNRRTARTEIMFAEAGLSYVYLCYGLHQMLNVVTGPKEHAHAVLIRSARPVIGTEHMMERRNKTNVKQLANGPGKLCQALGIDRKHNGIQLCSESSELWIAANEDLDDSHIMASPRVGVAYAEDCALWPWRFRLKNSPWTSPPKLVKYPSV